MGVINCIECGQLCIETPNKLCASCMSNYLDDEMKVAEFLRANENSSFEEVYQATKVKKYIILKMIKEGRIIEGKLKYSCENCKTLITSGRFCKSCSEKILESQEPLKKETTEEDHRMFINRIDDK